MMRDHIKFGMIQTEEAFQSLIRFAESFDHNVGTDSILPIYTIERGDHMIGYFNLITYPVVCPAFHPKICTPRDFFDAVLVLKNHFCLSSISPKFPNGTCLITLPTELEDFKRTAGGKVGFKNTNKELWQAIP
jgi:hypothetical protein